MVDIFKSVFHNWGQSVTSLSVRTVERELSFDRILKRILVFLHSYIYFGSVQKRSLYIFYVKYKKVKKTLNVILNNKKPITMCGFSEVFWLLSKNIFF